MNNRTLTLFTLLPATLLALGGTALFILSHTGDSDAQLNPPDKWIKLEGRPLTTTIEIAGHLESASRIAITAPFEGILQTLPAKDNMRVDRGQTLVSMDTGLLDIQSRQALAELLKATRAAKDIDDWWHSADVKRAQRALASATQALESNKRELDETRALYQKGIVARMEVDNLLQQGRTYALEVSTAREELDSTRAKGTGENKKISQMELANAQAKYNALELLRSNQIIKAPFSGITIFESSRGESRGEAPVVAAGNKVSQGQTLFELVNLEEMQAVGKVEESDLGQLKEGMSVDVTCDAFKGEHMQGVVRSIGSQALPSQGLSAAYEVIVSLPTPLAINDLRLGMSAKLTIRTYENPQALTVPPSAIFNKDGAYHIIYKENKDAAESDIAINVGRSFIEGVEILGVQQGYVKRLPLDQ